MKSGIARTIGAVFLGLVLILGAWGLVVVAMRLPLMLSSMGSALSAQFSSPFGNRALVASVAEESSSPSASAVPNAPEQSTPVAQKEPARTQPAVTPTPRAQAVSATRAVSNPNGAADLSVRIVSSVHGGAEFEISNAGTKTSASGWIFTAKLPLSPAYTYVSAPQQALMPGDKIAFTLGWALPSQNCSGYYAQPYPTPYPYYAPQYCMTSASVDTGVGTLVIVADPQNAMGDVNLSNNTATVNF